MRLQNFINESRSEEMTYDGAIDFIRKNCKDALECNTPIYRGNQRISFEYAIIQPDFGSERKSPFAYKNYYNLLFSNLPSWKNYPKRNKSIICTTSLNNAQHRGHDSGTYVVLPIDGSKIGVCPYGDIWDSFNDKGLDSMDYFNQMLSEFIRDIAGRSVERKADDDYKVFLKACDIIDKNKQEGLIDADAHPDWLEKYINRKNIKLIDYLSDFLSPDTDNFTLKKSGDKIPYNREVWTDGTSILLNITSELYQKFYGDIEF